MIFNLLNRQILDAQAWTTIIPGSKVAMSMVIRKHLHSESNLTVVRCPTTKCSGSWPRGDADSWAMWFVSNVIILCLGVSNLRYDRSPICQKEVLHSVLDKPNNDHAMTRSPPKDIGNKQAELDFRTARYPKHILKPNLSGQQRSTASLEEGAMSEEPKANDEEIAIFKRVVQQIVQFHETPSDVAMYSHPRSGISERDETESIISDDDTESVLLHPLINRYISYTRLVEHCRENLEQLGKQREELQEKRRRHISMDFADNAQDQKWLDISEKIEQTLDTLVLTEEKASQLKQDCLSRGLVDEDGTLVQSRGHVERCFFYEEGLDQGDQSSGYAKFPMPPVNPATLNQQLSPDSDQFGTSGQYTCTIKEDTINQWLLLNLRSSPLNVHQLEESHRKLMGQIATDQSWRKDVLAFWYQDGTDRPTLSESAYAQSLAEGCAREGCACERCASEGEGIHFKFLSITSEESWV